MATTSLELLIRVTSIDATRGLNKNGSRVSIHGQETAADRRPHSDLSDPLCRLRRIADRRIVPSLKRPRGLPIHRGAAQRREGCTSRTMCAMRQNIRIK